MYNEGRVIPEIHKKIGEKIRTIRTELGLTLEYVSEETGISISHLSGIELGKRRVHVDVLDAIASALGVETADLLQEDNPTESNVVDKQLGNLMHDWEMGGRKNEAAILLREFRNLTPDQINQIIETVKILKQNDKYK